MHKYHFQRHYRYYFITLILITYICACTMKFVCEDKFFKISVLLIKFCEKVIISCNGDNLKFVYEIHAFILSVYLHFLIIFLSTRIDLIAIQCMSTHWTSQLSCQLLMSQDICTWEIHCIYIWPKTSIVQMA